MKKINLLLLLVVATLTAQAQQFSFGPVVGFNAYDIEIEGPIVGGSAVSGLNLGGYADYQLNKRFGVRGMLTYNTLKENEYAYFDSNQYDVLFNDAELKTLQLHGLLRLDVAGEYNKGFYVAGGFRMVNVLSAKTDSQDVAAFYKKSNFGGLLGFGVTIARNFGIELLADGTLGSTLESGDKAKNYGVYVNLTANLQRLFE